MVNSTTQVGSYPGDGFTQLLPADKKKAELTMAELKQNLWVEMGTRVVFIDFSVYNANMNMFAVVKLVFEFPASGGVLPEGFYTVMKLIRYRSIYDYFIMASEFLLVAFLIFYCVEEVIEIRALKKKYFHGLYNNLDYVVIVLCFLVLGHRLFTFFVIEPSLKDINVDATSFIDFTVYSFWSYFLIYSHFKFFMRFSPAPWGSSQLHPLALLALLPAHLRRAVPQTLLRVFASRPFSGLLVLVSLFIG